MAPCRYEPLRFSWPRIIDVLELRLQATRAAANWSKDGPQPDRLGTYIGGGDIRIGKTGDTRLVIPERRSETGIRDAVGAALVILSTAFAVAACGGGDDGSGSGTGADLPQGSKSVDLDPADFTTRIDNPYRPMAPGSRRVYRDADSDGTVHRVEVRVTPRTKRIANGIEARVVRDVVTEHGELVEAGYDWYAQDSVGNVWYLGEAVKEYENGKVKATSSWEAGVDGAQPGVVMPAKPQAGLAYRQMYYAGEEEDSAEVLSADEQAQAPAGHFTDVVAIKDSSPLEPKVREYKFFARGVGLIRAFEVSGGSGHEELLSYSKGK
jgi:hypothetical protein